MINFKKKNVKFASIFLIVILLFCCITGCKKKTWLRTEDYFYEIVDGKIAIYTLTLEGRDKEEIIIPPFIDGKEVQFLCGKQDTLISNGYSAMFSDVMVRFYAPYTIVGVAGYNYNGAAISGENLESIFYPCQALFESADFSSNALIRVFSYGPTKSYVTLESYNFLVVKYEGHTRLKNILPANISYLFNYENSPNDNYYFIDHAEEESLIRNAPEPIRAGYAFDGWYKEAECINAWNFEVDTTPQAIVDENEKEVFQETKLYAKWQVK